MDETSKVTFVLAIVFPALALIVVLLRAWWRKRERQVFDIDDYFIFSATVGS